MLSFWLSVGKFLSLFLYLTFEYCWNLYCIHLFIVLCDPIGFRIKLRLNPWWIGDPEIHFGPLLMNTLNILSLCHWNLSHNKSGFFAEIIIYQIVKVLFLFWLLEIIFLRYWWKIQSGNARTCKLFILWIIWNQPGQTKGVSFFKFHWLLNIMINNYNIV